MLRTFALALAAVGLAATGAAGQLVLQHLDNDQDLVVALTDTLFVAEGRGGDGAGSATFELDLGPDTGAPAATAQHAWQNGAPEPFSLAYDAGSGLITFSLGGHVLHYTTPHDQFGDMFIRTRAVNDGSSIVVNDLQLDGQPLGDQSAAAAPGAGLDILWIAGAELWAGFELTGTATLAWTDALPAQSRLAFQVKVAHLGAVPADGATWGGIKALWR